MLTGSQIKAARALARISGSELASLAGISAPTVKRLEAMPGPIQATTATEDAIRKALDARGVVFDLALGEGPGVRLRDA